jgi:hypothetical protein
VVREQPWGLEDELIGELDLPLNLKATNGTCSTRH